MDYEGDFDDQSPPAFDRMVTFGPCRSPNFFFDSHFGFVKLIRSVCMILDSFMHIDRYMIKMLTRVFFLLFFIHSFIIIIFFID